MTRTHLNEIRFVNTAYGFYRGASGVKPTPWSRIDRAWDFSLWNRMGSPVLGIWHWKSSQKRSCIRVNRVFKNLFQAPDFNDFAQAMASVLSNISQFTVNADLNGTLGDYDIQVTSDLDRVLKSAANKVVQKQAAALEKELKKAISAKVGGPLEQTKGSLSGLDAIGNELSTRLNLGNGLLRGLKLPF